MIKVITKDDNRVVTCHYCKAILEYNATDIRVGTGECMDRDYKYLYIECPICKEEERVK